MRAICAIIAMLFKECLFRERNDLFCRGRLIDRESADATVLTNNVMLFKMQPTKDWISGLH